MISKNKLEAEIESLKSLSALVNAFEEIAATRIKRERDSVLVTRSFSEEINDIFEEVILSYKSQVNSLMRAKKIKDLNKFSFINKNNKTLYLIISANAGLYGPIVKKTFDLFMKTRKDKNYDVVIIGRLGLQMWKDSGIKDKYHYFELSDQKVENEKLKEILKFIIKYEKIVIFYGQFHNLIKQEATFSDISGNALIGTSTHKVHTKYLFEPSLEKIMEFFEKQILSSIFEQTVRESQLAKLGSRLTTLDKATQSIDKELKVMNFQSNRLTHQHENKKQLEMISSRTLWGK